MNRTLLESAVFVSCPEMEPIAEGIRKILHKKYPNMYPRVLTIEYTRFASGEYMAYIPETVRNLHILLFHAFQPDPMTSFLKFLIAADALRLGLAGNIKTVLPYIPFQRQDRKDRQRVPITAKLAWSLMDNNKKIDSSITLDLHSEQEQGFSENPLDNFPGVRIFSDFLCEKFRDRLDRLLILSPDMGSAKRTERLRDRMLEKTGMLIPVGIMDKRRPGPNVAKVEHYEGEDPKGRIILLYDDMIDTGGSSIGAADFMCDRGAEEVFLVASHGIFSSSTIPNGTCAEEKLRRSGHKVIVSNSIPRSPAYADEHQDWLTIVPIEETFAEIIDRAMRIGGSVSEYSK